MPASLKCFCQRNTCTRPLAVAAASSGSEVCTQQREGMAVMRSLVCAPACCPLSSKTSTCTQIADNQSLPMQGRRPWCMSVVSLHSVSLHSVLLSITTLLDCLQQSVCRQAPGGPCCRRRWHRRRAPTQCGRARSSAPCCCCASSRGRVQGPSARPKPAACCHVMCSLCAVNLQTAAQQSQQFRRRLC